MGSTFHFSIMVKKSTRQPARLLQTEQPRLGGKRLLVIAASADRRRAISRDARSWGMLPYVAGSSQEALYWIGKSEAFDVAVIDQIIVKNEGAALLEQIQTSHAKALPFICILDEGQQQLDNAALLAAHLPPSFTSSQLNNILAGIFSSVQSATAVTPPLSHSDSNAAGQHPLRILLVEDNRVNQKVATRLLGKLGYTVEVVENGRDAISALEKQPFDVIFMDIQMPEMDGLEATAAIRSQWPAGQQPQIIAMTAHALEGDREYFLSHGMDDYISKPIQIDKLVEALHKCQAAKASAENNGTVDAYGLIDQNELESLLGPNAQKIFEGLLPIYLKEAEQSLNSINQAISLGNATQLKQAAHSLKGNSANIALGKIAELCRALEDLDPATSHEEAAALTQRISRALGEVKKHYWRNPAGPQTAVNEINS
jgi:CheY-like chemotaxis protein/HPt (histidine-containing phosphotransfer) domain-containing protein